MQKGRISVHRLLFLAAYKCNLLTQRCDCKKTTCMANKEHGVKVIDVRFTTEPKRKTRVSLGAFCRGEDNTRAPTIVYSGVIHMEGINGFLSVQNELGCPGFLRFPKLRLNAWIGSV